MCSGAEDHIAEGKVITKAGPQSSLRVPLLFAHLHLKAEVCGSRPRAHRASRPRAHRASSPGREGRRSLPGGGDAHVMGAKLNTQMWMQLEEARGFPSFMLRDKRVSWAQGKVTMHPQERGGDSQCWG